MQSIFEYIQRQSAARVNRLYGAPAAPGASVRTNGVAAGKAGDGGLLGSPDPQASLVCKSVFQALRPLTKVIIMRMLLVQEPVERAAVVNWVQPSEIERLADAINEAISLRIFDSVVVIASSSNAAAAVDALSLNEHFARSLRHAISHEGSAWRATTERMLGEHQLDEYSTTCWERLLYFLVTVDPRIEMFDTVMNFLTQVGLITASRGKQTTYAITSKGYEYMLKDFHSQVWQFVLECLNRAPEYQEDIIRFVMSLSYCELGRGYSVSQLSIIQRKLLSEFVNLGIIYRENAQSEYFYPCRISINMLYPGSSSDISGSSGGGGEADASSNHHSLGSTAHQSIAVLVETNFQVTAYLTSSLHLAMISLFVDARTMIRMPDMVIGALTRDSIKESFKMGITASQIIDFLTTHAHPMAKARRNVVPENVSDQLVLWERENSRMDFKPAAVIDLSQVGGAERRETLYQMLLSHAQALNACIWSSDEAMMVAVLPEAHQQVLTYLRKSGV